MKKRIHSKKIYLIVIALLTIIALTDHLRPKKDEIRIVIGEPEKSGGPVTLANLELLNF